ncbi:hypothetical protein [Rossellomorea vietnamensis]|uniref:hypothetical protein n=1 Tax=Rossellomorea vietnamensis TaxID=218284 RepID=UPI000556291D|nr:hypothetical protein [Rossellomorea vietnamensis]
MQYIIKYHLGDNLAVSRIVEGENKEIALLNNSSTENITYEDTKGVIYRFNMSDVKLMTVHEYKNPTARSVKGFR